MARTSGHFPQVNPLQSILIPMFFLPRGESDGLSCAWGLPLWHGKAGPLGGKSTKRAQDERGVVPKGDSVVLTEAKRMDAEQAKPRDTHYRVCARVC